MASLPYDVKFTVGGNQYGFMLVTPPKQTKQLAVEEVGPPDAMRVQTEATISHQDFDPQQDTPFSMASFVGGLGQLEFDGMDDSGYWWGTVVTHVDGRAFLPPPASALSLTSATATIAGFCTHLTTAGARYDFCWEGPRLHRRDAANNTNAWSLVYTAAVDITDFFVFNGTGIIATPSSTNASLDFLTQADVTAAATWSPTTRNHASFSNGTKPKYIASSRGACFSMVDNNKVFYTVDPTQDAWLGPIETTVGALAGPSTGDGTYPFTRAVAVNDYVFTFSPAAGYNIDSEQNVTETFWQWKDKPSTENFKYVATGGDLLVFSVGPEVYTYDPGTGATMPLRLARRSGASVQSILGLDADNQYIYVLAQVRVPKLRSAASIALLRGHRAGGTRWAFECIWEDTTATETYATLRALPYGVGTRLYWGVTTGGATSTYVMDVPADWDESTGTAFATTGVLYTSITRASFAGFGKRHLWTNIEAEGTANPGDDIAVAYSIDGGVTWAALGTTDTATKWDYDNVSSRSIALRFTFTGSGTTTPVLRVFDHHQRVRFRYLQRVTAAVRIANNLELLNGTRDNRTLAGLRSELETLRTSEAEILYEDYTGNSFNVSVDMFTYRPTRHETPSDKGELEAILILNRADSGA